MPAPRSELKPITLAAAALAILCAALWGGLAVAIRFTQDSVPPIGTAGLRFTLGTFFMYVWCRYEGVKLSVHPGQWGPIVAVGVLLFAQIGTFHWGLTRTNSANGSVMIGCNPVFVAVIAHFALRGDPLSRVKLLGLLVAAAGMTTVILGSAKPDPTGQTDAATVLGNLVILFSCLLLASRTVFTKHALAVIEPGKLLFWSNALGTVMFFAYSAAFEGLDTYHLTTVAVVGLLYQGLVVAGFCFAAWTALLRRHRASQLAVFGFAQPLFGIVFGSLFRGDPVGLLLALGGLAVAVGIFLVTREPSPVGEAEAV